MYSTAVVEQPALIRFLVTKQSKGRLIEGMTDYGVDVGVHVNGRCGGFAPDPLGHEQAAYRYESSSCKEG